jgi:MYXO-CTERM domain-containing protein
MTRRIGQLAAAGILAAATSVAVGDFYAPGVDNGWDTSAPMTETFGGSGIWEYAASGLGAGTRTEWNIIAIAGDWGSQLFGSNQWGNADGAGDITLTLDTNTYADGWMPATNRIYTSTLAGQTWGATGNWVAAAGMGSDWDLASAPAMTNSGGIFELTIPGGTLGAGVYDWKPVANGVAGNWDSTGDGTGVNVNAGNNSFTSDGVSDIILQMDSSNGTVRAIPTPGALALVGVGGLAATRRRRR